MTLPEGKTAQPQSTRAALAAWVGLVGAFAARSYLALLVGLVLVATVPIMFGLSAVVIHGSSMRPVIGVGDVVLTRHFTPGSPVPMGRVVQFTAIPGSAASGPVMHRVVGTNKDGTLVTAGDGNTQVDSASLIPERIDATAVVLVRWVGLPLYWAASRDFLRLALWLLVTALAVAVEVAGLGGLPRGRRGSVIVPTSALVIVAVMAFLAAPPQNASAAFTAHVGNQGSRWIYPAAKAAVQLSFSTSPSGSTGGVALAHQPVVKLLDAAGAPTTGIRTVTLTLAGTAGSVLACTANPVTTVHGVAQFAGCSVDKVGTYTLVATATSLRGATSASLLITRGPATHMAVSTTPGTTGVVTAFATQPSVRLLDAGGNLSASTAAVTLSLTSAPSGTTLTCAQNPRRAVGGVATFSGCSVNKAGTYTITARSPSLTDVVTSSFVITGPALTCSSTTWMAVFSWSPTPYVVTVYTLYVNGVRVTAMGADGWNSYVQLTSGNVPASQFPAGTATVEVRKVLAGGGEQSIGTGTVVLGEAGFRTYLCGR